MGWGGKRQLGGGPHCPPSCGGCSTVTSPSLCPPHFWAMEELLDFWGEGMLGGAKRLYHLQQHNLAPGGAVHPTGSGHGEVRGPSVLLFCPPPPPPALLCWICLQGRPKNAVQPEG